MVETPDPDEDDLAEAREAQQDARERRQEERAKRERERSEQRAEEATDQENLDDHRDEPPHRS